MIHRIYIDLDDVLNTLVPSIFSFFGIVTKQGTAVGYRHYPSNHGWDVIGAVNDMEVNVMRGPEIDRYSFWGSFGRGFWATIPKTDECDWLLATAAHQVGREGVFILTKAVGANSLAGKHDWVNRNLPEWMHDRMITCAHKDCCAASDSLLIDDNQDNIQAFAARGGHVIMRPRPWNDLWELDFGYVKTQLKALFSENNVPSIGKTERMLRMAWEAAQRGEKVAVVARNSRHMCDLRAKYADVYRNIDGVTFISATNPCIDLNRNEIKGFRGKVLYDHYVFGN